jgi:hypothetical protein
MELQAKHQSSLGVVEKNDDDMRFKYSLYHLRAIGKIVI